MKTFTKTALALQTTAMLLTAVTSSFAQNVPTSAQDSKAAVGAALFTLGFPAVHGNGRTCATCHVPDEAFQLTPEHVEARYQALQQRRRTNPKADDPLFRPIDANDGPFAKLIFSLARNTAPSGLATTLWGTSIPFTFVPFTDQTPEAGAPQTT